MLGTIEELQEQLGFVFSESFCRFWNQSIPDKVLPFRILKSELPVGRFAEVGPDSDQGWLIKIRSELPLGSLGVEIGIAHEIMHLILYKEGFPGVCLIGGDKSEIGWEVIADALQSILTHPIISYRMKKRWGFPIDNYLGIEIYETLCLIRRSEISHPLGFQEGLQWLFTYILNRFDNVDIVCNEIATRLPFIEKIAQDYLDLMISYGYSEPASLTPEMVVDMGNILY